MEAALEVVQNWMGPTSLWVGEWVTLEVTKAILSGVKSVITKNELDRAVKKGLEAASEHEFKLHSQERGLFYQCYRRDAQNFLKTLFKKDACLRELQKPLLCNEKPDVAILVAAFKQLASNHSSIGSSYEEAEVRPWMEIFTRTYFEQTATFLGYHAARENYLTQLQSCFGDIKFAGIPVAGQEIERSERLFDIFVMPDVAEQLNSSAHFLPQELYTTTESGHPQVKLLNEQRQRAKLQDSTGQVFSGEDLLTQSQLRKVVLLGAPGSGKSTLLSYFAIHLARQTPPRLLPIVIRIRDMARHLEKHSILEYLRLFAERTLAVRQLPPGFFEHWLEDGRALILFDGLDEVVDGAKRNSMAEKIGNFLTQFTNNRAIITSRPGGYRRDFFRTQDFPHFEIQPFDGEKIETFIDSWYSSRVSDPEEAERRKESLRRALSHNKQISRLARNPLLLTITALIHRYQAVLPKDRFRLYEKAVETLLTSWDANKELSNEKVFRYLTLDNLPGLMKDLAYWIHKQGGTGQQDGGTLIGREELVNQVSLFIKRKKQVELCVAQQEAVRLVDFLRDRTGLLNEQGQDCYAFVHKTFQEYLCAEKIRYDDYNEDDPTIIPNHIKQHLHDPHWEQVLLLLVAQLPPRKAAKAIKAVISNGSLYEQWLHRDLLFAGRCLAEDPRDLGTEGDAELAQDIIRRLVELEITAPFNIREKVFGVIKNLNDTAFAEFALRELKRRKDNVGDFTFQRYRAVLGERQAVIDELISRLLDEKGDVRKNAAFVLGQLDEKSERVVSQLLKSLKDEDSRVRTATVFALKHLGDKSEQVIFQLLKSLQDEENFVRYASVLALRTLGDKSKVLVSQLLNLLQDEDSHVRTETIFTLLHLGDKSEQVISQLFKLLQDKDNHVRRAAAFTVEYLGDKSEQTTSHLLELVQDKDNAERKAATFALGILGDRSKQVISQLLNLLHDEESDMRYAAASALEYLGDKSEQVISRLVNLLEDKESHVRRAATSSLSILGDKSEKIVSRVLKMLRDEESEVRHAAVVALGTLGDKSEKVVSQLLGLLQDNESEVRRAAVSTLGILCDRSEQVVSQLLELLQDEDWYIRFEAVCALPTIIKNNLHLIDCLTSWIEKSADPGDGINVLSDVVSSEA